MPRSEPELVSFRSAIQPAETTKVRPGNNCLWTMAMLVVVAVIPSTSIAQETAKPNGEAAIPMTGGEPKLEPVPGFPQVKGPLARVGPDTFILFDAQGRPQPVLGMSYEDFMEAWKKLRELDDARREPTYILEALHAEGRIEGDTAILTIRLEIELKSAELVEVPIGFRGAILRDNHVAQPEVQLSYDETRGGYVAWLRSPDHAKVVIDLPLLVPLKRDGNKTLLQLNFPRALINQFQLDSAQRIVSPAVTEGAVVRLSDHGSDGSRMTVTGVVGDIALSWSAPGAETTELETVLSAAGQITTTIDRHSARSEAQLRVESFGGQFQQFRVRLPPGARLVNPDATDAADSQPEYKLLPEDTSVAAAENQDAQGQIWIVDLGEASSGPVDVRIVTEQAIGLSREGALTELSGFEVLGAVRQFGELILRVDPTLQLRWNQIEGGRQINVPETDRETADDSTPFAFEYYQQPWSLPVEIIPRGTRVVVSPKYRMELYPGEARLTVTLLYQLSGSQEMLFRVKLAGWEVTADPIEPTRLVDPNNVLWKRDPVLEDEVLELRLTQAAARRTEIKFYARRSLNEQSTKIDLPLPTPLADSISTGDLVVLAHPSLTVVPRAAQEGLSPLPRTELDGTTVEAGLRQIATYRSVLVSPMDQIAFSAEVSPRAGEVEAAIESHLEVGRQLTQIDHVLNYDVKYQPINEVYLSVPSGLMSDPSFRLTLLAGNGGETNDNREAGGTAEDGVPLEFRVADVSEGPESDGATDVIAVALPQPKLGGVRLRVAYSMHSAVARDGALAPMVVRLPMPFQVQVSEQVALVSADQVGLFDSVQAARDSAWNSMPTTDSMEASTTVLKANAPANELALSFRATPSSGEGRTVVDKVWLQSWCASDVRQQRAAYRFRSDANTLTIELPPRITGQKIEVSLDGNSEAECERRDAQIVIPLLPTEEMTAHTLVLRYLESTTLDPFAQLQVEMPQIGGESAFAEFYWHVIVPKNYWIVQGPSRLAQAHTWTWSPEGVRPKPFDSSRNSEVLSDLGGARKPSTGEAEYLYGGFGSAPMLAAWVVRSEILHLIIAAFVLAGGLALLYAPAFRRPSTLLVAAVVLISLGAIYPQVLLIFGPALAIGAALALLACLLFVLAPRRLPIESAASASTAHGTFMSSRDSYLPMQAAASSNAPTITLRPSESNA